MEKCKCSSHAGGEGNRKRLVGSRPKISIKLAMPCLMGLASWQLTTQDQVNGMRDRNEHTQEAGQDTEAPPYLGGETVSPRAILKPVPPPPSWQRATQCPSGPFWTLKDDLDPRHKVGGLAGTSKCCCTIQAQRALVPVDDSGVRIG
jgi:hypothetical protein